MFTLVFNFSSISQIYTLQIITLWMSIFLINSCNHGMFWVFLKLF